MRAFVAMMMVGALLAGCMGETPGPEEPAQFADGLHDISEPIDGVSVAGAIVENYRTLVGPAEEQLEVDTWIVRPDIDGPVPVVLEVTPYYPGGRPCTDDLAACGPSRLMNELVPRGYAVGVSSVRGTGNSQGCFSQGGPEEAEDTAKVVEHMASMPWSNGNVGIIGVSYPGTTPQDVWVEATPALKTIVPISGISDLYKYNFVNGVPINIQGFGFNTYYWALVGAAPFPAGVGGSNPGDADPTHVATAPAGEACEEQVAVQEGGVSSTADGNKDDYWQVRDFHAELRDSWDKNERRASVFYIHGLQDWNVKPHMMEDWLPAIQETGVPYKIWLGQWGHAWPAPTGSDCDEPGTACRADWWDQTLVAWFDQFLKDIDTGVLDGPAVQVQDDDGIWRHEETWPPEDVDPVVFGLTETELTADGGTGSVTYHDLMGGLAAPLAPIAQGPDRVVWTSEPLEEDIHVSGLPVFHANVTASGQRASLMLSLGEEVDGAFRAVNFAALSLNHAAGLEAGTADISGMTQEVALAFFPQDDVLHAGNRIVLIASGNLIGSPAPGLQPVSDGSTITIDLDGAWLELPIDRTLNIEDPQPYT